MKKWYGEEYEWEIEVIGFHKEDQETERFCRNGGEAGDTYTCTYGCPVNAQGQGICSKAMLLMFPVMESCAQRRGPAACRRRQVQQGADVPGRLCAVPYDGKAAWQ